MLIVHFALCPYLFSNIPMGDEMMVIDSGIADYDGKMITLCGQVVVEHEIGKILANQMVLIPENEKKIRFSLLKMNDNVKISFRDGGELNCAKAELNYVLLSGQFFGDWENDYVIYTENCRDQKGEGIPLVVKSRRMAIQIDREEASEEHKAKSSISEITAENNVTVNYNHDFVVAADFASFRRLPLTTGQIPQGTLPGMITFQATEKAGICQITNRNGDTVHANQICIDTTRRQLLFICPKGTIFDTDKGEKTHHIDFTCENMVWDDAEEVLRLKDRVLINQEGLGQLKTNEEVCIHRGRHKGCQALKFIESCGETNLNVVKEDQQFSHLLKCYGKVLVNHLSLVTTMDSPRDHQGNVIPGKQLSYQDQMGEIYADKMSLDYELLEGRVIPKKLILQGNVKILNRTVASSEDTGVFLQYALADNVEYFPQNKEMKFSCLGPRRVLFFDKTNNVQVSAPSLRIQRDPSSSKNSLKGEGDVRFSFIETELDQLRQRFGFKSMQKEQGEVR